MSEQLDLEDWLREHPANSDDRNAKVWFELYLKKAKENQQLKDLLKECGEMSFKIRLALSSGKINDVFTLTYQIENEIVKATGEK